MMGLEAMIAALGLSPKGIVYAGAHDGEHLPEMLACGFRRVLMVEPNPRNRATLEALVDDSVSLVPAALAERAGRVPFWAGEGRFEVWSSIFAPGEAFTSRTSFDRFEVDAVTLEEVVGGEDVNVLYMNIQGAELAAVKGAGAALARFDAIACEVDFEPRYENHVLYPDLERYLADAGFVNVGLWRNEEPTEPYGMACFAHARVVDRRSPRRYDRSMPTPGEATPFASARAPDARRELLAVARARRAERIVGEVLACADVPRDLAAAIAEAPKSPSCDRALAQLANGDEASVVRAALLVAGDVAFEAKVGTPTRFCFRGRLTPPCTFVRFDPAKPAELFVRLRSGKDAVVRDDGVELPSFALGDAVIRLVPGWALDAMTAVGVEHLAGELSVTETPLLVRQAEALGGFFREASPAHLGFVADVVTEIVPLDGRDGRLRSQSHPAVPGRIAATFHGSPAKLAELLVHEASHQYFHLASELGPLHDGSDETLYWSPAKKTGRPIERILLAFHAWANIAELFESCLARGVDPDGHAASSLEAIREDMAPMRAALLVTRALTPLGRSLAEPFL